MQFFTTMIATPSYENTNIRYSSSENKQQSEISFNEDNLSKQIACIPEVLEVETQIGQDDDQANKQEIIREDTQNR